jgi:hypothetical protein
MQLYFPNGCSVKKQTRRKVYALINPLSYVFESIKPPEGDKLRKLQTVELVSIEAFRTGTATINDWSKVVGMMNLAENMASNGIGIEVMEVCKEAHDHLVDAAQRYQKTLKMGLTGPGIQCIRNLYQYHDLQRASVPMSVYEKHIKDTVNRVRSKAPEVTDVMEKIYTHAK